MISSLTHAFCLLAFLSVPYGGLAAADEDVARLKARVEKLEAENKALRAEVVRLKDEYKVPGGKSDEARLATDFRRLVELDQALRKAPADSKVRQEAAELAKRLAKLQPGKVVWQVLLNTGVLKDGMSVAEAEKLLGPATGKSDRHVEWYFNPGDKLHVAPNLTAKVTKDGLSGWKVDRR